MFGEMKNVIEVFPVHFLEVPKLLKTMVNPLDKGIAELVELLFVDAQDHQMVQSLLRHGPERVFLFIYLFIYLFFKRNYWSGGRRTCRTCSGATEIWLCVIERTVGV